MIKNCIFRLPSYSKEHMIKTFNLSPILLNDRTSIFQNDDMRFCIDEKVVRVILFDMDNIMLLEKLRRYFYGEEYKKMLSDK